MCWRSLSESRILLNHSSSCLICRSCRHQPHPGALLAQHQTAEELYGEHRVGTQLGRNQAGVIKEHLLRVRAWSLSGFTAEVSAQLQQIGEGGPTDLVTERFEHSLRRGFRSAFVVV